MQEKNEKFFFFLHYNVKTYNLLHKTANFLFQNRRNNLSHLVIREIFLQNNAMSIKN